MDSAKSTIALDNLQEMMDAAADEASLRKGQAQYETPPHLAKELWSVLQSQHGHIQTVFDPQIASGNLVRTVPYGCQRFGIDIDRRFEDDVERNYMQGTFLTGHCVKLFEIVQDMYPNLRFDCAVANPPFGIRWKWLDDESMDSTLATWKIITGLANFGYLIGNANNMRKLGLTEEHELIWKFQEHEWEDADVKVGVAFWKSNQQVHVKNKWEPHGILKQAGEIMRDEAIRRSPYNIWLDDNGLLRTYLSVRKRIKRKLTGPDIMRLSRIDGQHPFSLTPDRETRKLLAELVENEVYDIDPECQKVIDEALESVNKLAIPIMPVTDFETVAYADEEDTLECVARSDLHFTPGKKYELKTMGYTFSEPYTRKKVHYDEAEEETYTLEHQCQLTGQDRKIRIMDDWNMPQDFMDKPRPGHENQHQEAKLWEIFKPPEVLTVLEQDADGVSANERIMKVAERLAGFTYYDGQRDFYRRVCTKRSALVAAETGTGKTLGAITLVTLKGAKRALIIAPQGTMKSSKYDDEESFDDMGASQWIEELRKFAPYFHVFELFSMEDYHRIKRLNGGELPEGVYVSYYEAMFYNKAVSRCPASWNDASMCAKYDLDPPDHYDEEVTSTWKIWTKTVGEERNGIRCVLKPPMSELIGHEFDFVALDEAHRITNLRAIISECAIRLQPTYRYALTATPIPNIVSNIFSLMGWLCVDEWYKYGRCNAAWPYRREDLNLFNRTFLSVERDFTEEQIKRQKNPNFRGRCQKASPVISSPARLLKILKPNLAYISKPECNPEYVRPETIDVRVPMGEQQAKLYGWYMDRAHIPYDNPMVRAAVQLTYLRGICTYPAYCDYNKEPAPVVTSNFNPKIIAILELIRDILGRGEQVVIVNSRVGVGNEIQGRLEEAGVSMSRIDTTVPAKQHAYQAQLFKRQKTKVMIMGIKCAQGHSFDLCPNLIIGSLEYSYGPFEQGKGRVDRIASKGARIYCILNEKTIEEIMFDTVATKQDAATICLQGKRVPRDFKPADMGEVLATSIMQWDHTIKHPDEAACELQWETLKEELIEVAAVEISNDLHLPVDEREVLGNLLFSGTQD